eukprot:1192435-Prorocentrum_minimum.AAC.6
MSAGRMNGGGLILGTSTPQSLAASRSMHASTTLLLLSVSSGGGEEGAKRAPEGGEEGVRRG